MAVAIGVNQRGPGEAISALRTPRGLQHEGIFEATADAEVGLALIDIGIGCTAADVYKVGVLRVDAVMPGEAGTSGIDLGSGLKNIAPTIRR